MQLFDEMYLTNLASEVIAEHDYYDDESPADAFKWHLEQALAKEFAHTADDDADDPDVKYFMLAEKVIEEYIDAEAFYNGVQEDTKEARECYDGRFSG